MKRTLRLIIVIQLLSVSFVFSQTTAPVKPATDACPSWNSKPIADKADYFTYLSKRPKKQDAGSFYTPKYQNFNAAQTTPQQKKGTVVENPDVKQTNTPGIIYGKERQADLPNEVIIETKTPEPFILKKKEEIAVQEKKDKETPPPVAAEKKSAPESVKENGDSDTKKEEKRIGKTKKIKMKHSKKHWFKNLCFGKKNASKCPKF